MSKKLRKNLVVTYSTPEEAEAALKAAKAKFGANYKRKPACIDFNQVRGRNVIWEITHSIPIDAMVKEFLLKQEGALPEGVHC